MNLEWEPRPLANALDQSINGIRGERRAALRLNDVAAAGLALQLAKSTQLVAADRVRRRLAILGPPNVQSGGAIKFDLRPFQIANLDGTQAVPVSHQDQSRVSMPIAAFAGGPDKRFDLRWRQILTRPQFAIARPRRSRAPRPN